MKRLCRLEIHPFLIRVPSRIGYDSRPGGLMMMRSNRPSRPRVENLEDRRLLSASDIILDPLIARELRTSHEKEPDIEQSVDGTTSGAAASSVSSSLTTTNSGFDGPSYDDNPG